MKVTKVSNMYEYFKQVCFKNSGNFWAPPCTQGAWGNVVVKALRY
jgi:hypothetical protein